MDEEKDRVSKNCGENATFTFLLLTSKKGKILVQKVRKTREIGKGARANI